MISSLIKLVWFKRYNQLFRLLRPRDCRRYSIALHLAIIRICQIFTWKIGTQTDCTVKENFLRHSETSNEGPLSVCSFPSHPFSPRHGDIDYDEFSEDLPKRDATHGGAIYNSADRVESDTQYWMNWKTEHYMN